MYIYISCHLNSYFLYTYGRTVGGNRITHASTCLHVTPLYPRPGHIHPVRVYFRPRGDVVRGVGVDYETETSGALSKPGLKHMQHQFYSILFHSIYAILFHSILFHSVPLYSILVYSILFYSSVV